VITHGSNGQQPGVSDPSDGMLQPETALSQPDFVMEIDGATFEVVAKQSA
jgi:hypothetical protein